tara:strand:+ start:28 stop:243 length:216 start_codon:yes stop_codon:yes gene_type:complete
MTIENIIKDIENKTILNGNQYVCNWYGKDFHGQSIAEVTQIIIAKYNLGTMPTIKSSGNWLKPRRNTWRNR